MKKTILKQMNPESIWWENNWRDYIEYDDNIDNFIIGGNRDFKEFEKISDKLLSYVKDHYNELDAIYDIAPYVIDDIYNILNKKISKKKLSTILYEAGQYEYSIKQLFNVVDKLRPEYYVLEQVSGYSQSDWAYILTTKENEKNIEFIEAHYFGKYNEYEIIEQENGEDDYLLNIILTDNERWEIKDMKKYIKDIYGYEIDEFMEFKGYEKVESYETITY